MKTFTNVFVLSIVSLIIGILIFTIISPNYTNAFAQKNGFDKELNLLNQSLTALEK